MIKKLVTYLIIVVFVGLTIWFLVDKSRRVSNDADLINLAIGKSTTPTPTATDTEKMINDSNDNFVTLDNGLKILDVRIGYGREARPGDTIAAHYSGTLENGNKFDSSYDRADPFVFVLGAGKVIPGWDIGIAGMKVGGKRKLIIPPDLAYGDKEMGGGIIPANSTLLFDIELVAVQDAQQR